MTSPGTLTATGVFYATGLYTVELDLTDSNGETASSQVMVDVQGDGLTITSLTANPNPVVGNTGPLVAQVVDPSSATVNYSWMLMSAPPMAPPPMLTPSTGSASVSNPLTTTVTYYAPGSYEFALDVSDGTQSVSDTVTVTVNAATPSIALTANPNPVTSGTTTALSGTVTDANESSPDYQYTWSVASAPPSVPLPTFTQPSSGTTYSLPITTTATFYAAGSYRLQLAITDTWGMTATSTVNVTLNSTLSTITVAPATATLAQGTTQQLTAQAYDQFHQLLSPQPSVNWLVASGPGTVSSSGLYTAPTTSTGTAVVQAIATVGSVTVSGSATVTVTGQAPVISNISANPNPVTGTTTTLSVTASDPSGGNLSYAWSVLSKPSGSAAPSLAASTAATTGATFYAAGSYEFGVVVTSSVTGASASASVWVTVAQTLTRVTVSPSLSTISDGQSLQLIAYAYDQFLHAMSATFSWSKTSGPGTIDANGLFTAPASGSGKAVIMATATINGVTQSGTATIRIG